MERQKLFIVGAALVLLGVLSLLIAGGLSLLGFNLGAFVLRLWPSLVTAVGLCFVVPPLLVRGKRGLGALFIPGMPILTTGGILMLAGNTHGSEHIRDLLVGQLEGVHQLVDQLVDLAVAPNVPASLVLDPEQERHVVEDLQILRIHGLPFALMAGVPPQAVQR